MSYGGGSVYKQKKRLPDGTRVEVQNWSISWYTGDGKQHRESCGSPDRRVAEKLLRRRLALRESGKPFIAPKAEKLTLREMLDDLKENYRFKENRSDVARQSRVLIDFFGGDARVIGIKPDRIKTFVSARRERLKNSSVNRDLAVLQRAFNIAVENGKLGHDHVPRRMPYLPEPEPRQGFVDRRDFERLREHLPEDLKLPVWFLYATGWRLSAMRNREWGRDVEAERDASGAIIGGVIHLHRKDSKNKRPYYLPLTGELLAIIRAADERRDPHCPYIFHRGGAKLGTFYHAWRNACVASGIDAARKARGFDHLLIHDLRRSRIRNLIRSGVSQTVAMAVSGHKTADVFRRYDITAHEDLEDAMLRSEAYDAREALKPEREPARVISLHQRKSA